MIPSPPHEYAYYFLSRINAIRLNKNGNAAIVLFWDELGMAMLLLLTSWNHWELRASVFGINRFVPWGGSQRLSAIRKTAFGIPCRGSNACQASIPESTGDRKLC